MSNEIGKEGLLRQLNMWLLGCKHDTETIYMSCKICPSKKTCKQAKRKIVALIKSGK